jgi:hypothetical protein
MKIVVFIFILIFTYDSELLNVYLGASNVFLVKIIIFFMLFLNVSTKKIKLFSQEKYVIFFLVIIHLYISVISVSYTGFEGLIWSFKFLIRFTSIIFFIMSLELYHLKSFIKWYRVIALILSVQSILLFVSIYLNISLPTTLIERHSSQDLFNSYGLLGFGNANTGYSFRTQSFFSESTNFAKFLVLPFFSYLNEFFNSRKKYTLLKVVVILAALFTTFSLTAFIGIVVGFVLFIIIKRKGAKGLVSYAPILGLVFFGLYKVVTSLIDKGVNKQTLNIVSGSFQKGDESIIVRSEYLFDVLNIISNYPFGVGYNIVPFSSFGFLPIAPTRWLIFGGWFGLLLILILHRNFLRSWSRSINNDYYKFFFVVCVSQFLISLVHGTWTEFVYWINFVMLLKLSKWEKKIKY